MAVSCVTFTWWCDVCSLNTDSEILQSQQINRFHKLLKYISQYVETELQEKGIKVVSAAYIMKIVLYSTGKTVIFTVESNFNNWKFAQIQIRLIECMFYWRTIVGAYLGSRNLQVSVNFPLHNFEGLWIHVSF